jgi:5-methyltetrahydrofolate--homocysteine methyltransferase
LPPGLHDTKQTASNAQTIGNYGSAHARTRVFAIPCPERQNGPEVTERIEREGEFAEQLFVHGLGVQTVEGLAEWLHSDVRQELDIPLDQGRRYSWGYPACPDQSEHEKVWRLLDLESIGMTLSDGYAVLPEQSTVTIVAHHPQAVYFGMKSGFIPKDTAPDELIADTERGGTLSAT